jgi:hypothetical protein
MEFQPGFRLSVSDSLVLASGLVLAGFGYKYSAIASFVILFVIGHFFLFCNLLRMSRIPELIWATSFIVLATASMRWEQPPWTVTALLCQALTLILAVIESRKPSYHGIFWQRLNPGLPEWFQQHMVKD